MTVWVVVLVETSCSAHRCLHSEYAVDQCWLADASLLQACRQHWPEIGESQIPFLQPEFGTLGVSTSRMALSDHPDSPGTPLKYFGSGRWELKAFIGRAKLLSLLIYDLDEFDAGRGSLLQLLYSWKGWWWSWYFYETWCKLRMWGWVRKWLRRECDDSCFTSSKFACTIRMENVICFENSPFCPHLQAKALVNVLHT